MRPEILSVINSITDEGLIRDMYYNMSSRDLFFTFNSLEYANEEAMDRWVKVYNELIKRA